MEAAVTIAVGLAALALAGIAVWLLLRLVRTIVELKKITVMMRRVLGQVLAEPVGDGGVVDGTVAGERQLKSG